MIIVYIYQICLGPEVENSLSHAQPNEEKATSFCCCSISPFIYTAESGERAPNSDDSSTLTQRICNSPPSQENHLQIRNSAMFNIYVRPFWVIPRSSRHTPGTSLRFSVYIPSHSRYRTIFRWMWVTEVRCNFLEKQESRYKTCDCFSSCKLFFVLQAKTKIRCKMSTWEDISACKHQVTFGKKIQRNLIPV